MMEISHVQGQLTSEQVTVWIDSYLDTFPKIAHYINH